MFPHPFNGTWGRDYPGLVAKAENPRIKTGADGHLGAHGKMLLPVGYEHDLPSKAIQHRAHKGIIKAKLRSESDLAQGKSGEET